jgi:alpha/beta superfamily hydrolase
MPGPIREVIVGNTVREIKFTSALDETVLEGDIRCGGSPGVVLCHPHSLYGGSMDSIVVSTLYDALGSAGFSALRFNFRGVGGSEGSFGGGSDEVGDVLGALEHLKSECRCGALMLVGYSFGAAVALRALGESEAVGFAAVALPTEMGSEMYGAEPVEVAVPSLLAAGDRDEICRIENVGRVARFRSPPETVLLKGCDHFFSSIESLNELCENVLRFVRDIGKEQA